MYLFTVRSRIAYLYLMIFTILTIFTRKSRLIKNDKSIKFTVALIFLLILVSILRKSNEIINID